MSEPKCLASHRELLIRGNNYFAGATENITIVNQEIYGELKSRKVLNPTEFRHQNVDFLTVLQSLYRDDFEVFHIHRLADIRGQL